MDEQEEQAIDASTIDTEEEDVAEDNDDPVDEQPDEMQPEAAPAAETAQIDPDADVDVDLDEIDEETKERWIEELIFQDQVTDERTMANGRVTVTLSINSGQDSLDISKEVQDLIDDDNDVSPQYVNTSLAIAQAAHAIESVNGKVPGGNDIKQKIDWLKSKSGIFIDEILRLYQEFEAELQALLQEDGIKKS
jgi:hypothetical protein